MAVADNPSDEFGDYDNDSYIPDNNDSGDGNYSGDGNDNQGNNVDVCFQSYFCKPFGQVKDQS